MKTIWITGGSSGIGFATAKIFLKKNWRVVISSSNIQKLENAKKRISNNFDTTNLHILKCDISSKKEVGNVVNTIEKEIGPIDIALLNAAAYSPNKEQKFDLKNYELLIDVNLKGTLYCINSLKNLLTHANQISNIFLKKSK